eukprot:14327977-Alexandrium_andersonii.AAC.1
MDSAFRWANSPRKLAEGCRGQDGRTCDDPGRSARYHLMVGHNLFTLKLAPHGTQHVQNDTLTLASRPRRIPRQMCSVCLAAAANSKANVQRPVSQAGARSCACRAPLVSVRWKPS